MDIIDIDTHGEGLVELFIRFVFEQRIREVKKLCDDQKWGSRRDEEKLVEGTARRRMAEHDERKERLIRLRNLAYARRYYKERKWCLEG